MYIILDLGLGGSLWQLASKQSSDAAILNIVTESLGPSATQVASHLPLPPEKKDQKIPDLLSTFLHLAFCPRRLNCMHYTD